MVCDLLALTFDAHDPPGLARFWGGLLGWETKPTGRTLVPADDTGFLLHFEPSSEPKREPNRIHLDLTSNLTSQEETVARALALGARHIDVGQGPEDLQVVLADPEGNEFCVIEPGNAFLADCGRIGALASDGTPAVGYFWAEALGWPLVWDQDEETAIRAPHGGPKITWGGPPIPPRTGKVRVHLDLTPAAGATVADEVERLLALGATRADIGQGDVGWAVLADPDGNEFCILPRE